MNLADIGKQIAQYGAPLLGSIIAGNTGANIANILVKEFGGNVNTETGLMELAENIHADPETRIKLAEIESTNKIELQKILLASESSRLQNEVEIRKLANENTMNAREENLKKHSWFPEILSVLVTFGFFLCIYWIAAFHQDKGDEQVLYLLLGVMGTSFNCVVNYWIGSSAMQDFRLTK